MTRGAKAAINLRDEIGISDPNEIPIETVIEGRGGYLVIKPMGNVDGRIVHGKNISTVFINSDIRHPGRKKFAMAHELGHLEMHRGIAIHDDSSSLDWFNNAESKLKGGNHELEANQFASEYLMPMHLFKQEAAGKSFGPELLKALSERFETSITSVAFRYFEANLFPIAMFHVFDGIVRYWKKSDDLKVWIKNLTKLPPPTDSVASEYIEALYQPIYSSEELKQEINKSTWFSLNDEDQDSTYFEYCIVSRNHKNILSIVWEE